MDDRLLARFLTHPGRQAAVIGLNGAVWTFDEVLGRALTLAQQLRVTADITGRVVLLRAGPGPMFTVADLAVLLAGAVPAVLPDLPRDQVEALWPVVRPAAVLDTVGDGALALAAAHAQTPLHTADTRSTRPGGTPAQWRRVAHRMARRRSEPIAAIVFTSGATGVPRAVALSETALARGTDAWTAQWASRPSSTLSYLPVSHIAQRIMGHTLMCLYGTAVIASTSTRLDHDLRRHRPDTVLGVPRVWARLAAACRQPGESGQQLRHALAAVRTAINGAAAVDRTVADTLHHHTGLRLCGAYGATETTVPAFHHDDAAAPGLGRPVDVEHQIDHDGRLLLRGPHLAAGYVEQWPRLVPVTNSDGWLPTGDLAKTRLGGGLCLTGRSGSAFKTGAGETIHPEPTEAHLLTHPAVDAACLLGPRLPRAIALVSAPTTQHWPQDRVTALERELLGRVETARRAGDLPYNDLAAVHVLPDRWPELLLVTSTGKPRRVPIAAHYNHLLPTPETTVPPTPPSHRPRRVLLIDMGGVFFTYSFLNALDTWADAAGQDSAQLRERWRIDTHFDDFERGEIEPAAYLEHLRQLLAVDLSDEQLARGWNSIYGTTDPALLALLAAPAVRGRFEAVAGVSNTNTLHAAYWRQLYRQELPVLDTVHCSHEIGVTKPDQAFFDHVAAAHHTTREHLVLVDDIPLVTDTATALGMHAHTYQGPTALASYLEALDPAKDRP